MSTFSPAEVFKLCSRIERVAAQGVWDAPARETVRKAVKLLLTSDSLEAGRFLAKLLHDGLGREAADAAYASVTKGISIGDDARAVTALACYCLVTGNLRSLRPIVEAGPPPVAPAEVQALSKAHWLSHLCDTHTPLSLKSLSPKYGIAVYAVLNELSDEKVEAALQLSWDADPEHVEVFGLAEMPSSHGAKARAFIMRERIDSNPAAEASNPPAPRARARGV